MLNTWQTRKIVIAARWFCLLLNIDHRVRCVFISNFHKEPQVFRFFFYYKYNFTSNIHNEHQVFHFLNKLQYNRVGYVYFIYSLRTLGFSFFSITKQISIVPVSSLCWLKCLKPLPLKCTICSTQYKGPKVHH